MNEVFPDVLVLRDMGIIKGTRVYQLENDFRYFSSEGLLEANKGFLTDGFSVPQCLHAFCNPMAMGMESAIFHDMNYLKSSPYDFDRATVDRLFLEGMKACGVRLIKRNLIYAAVRSAGWMFWKKR